MVRFFLPALAILVLLGGAVYFHSEMRRVALKVVLLETDLAAASVEQDATAVRLAAAQQRSSRQKSPLSGQADRIAEQDALLLERARVILDLQSKLEASDLGLELAASDIRRLESELKSELDQREGVSSMVDEVAAALRAERERHSKEIAEARVFMPETVRQVLVTANQCLRVDGQQGLRFFKASKIEDKVLHDVQLFDSDATALTTTIYLAGQMTFDLDRSTGNLTLTLHEGSMQGPNGRVEFDSDGHTLVLPGVDGANWEIRLPFLVNASGEYPVPVSRKKLLRMPANQRLVWLKRVNHLLGQADNLTGYEVSSFLNLEGGRFTGALLLGYENRGNILSMSVEANELWVHVADGSGRVELHLRDGIIRQSGGVTPISETGYILQILGVEPSEAIETMQGMVIRE